jgi:single-stranded DNA-binding protein
MIDALIGGKLRAKPTRRTAQSERVFTTAKALASIAAGAAVFVNVVAFSAPAQFALLALDAGDSVAIAGAVTPKAHLDREGTPKVSLDVIAQNVLTPFMLARKCRDARPEEQRARWAFLAMLTCVLLNHSIEPTGTIR